MRTIEEIDQDIDANRRALMAGPRSLQPGMFGSGMAKRMGPLPRSSPA